MNVVGIQWVRSGNILEELGFAGTGITDDADVEITTEMDTFLCLLVDTAHKLEKDSLLNDLVT